MMKIGRKGGKERIEKDITIEGERKRERQRGEGEKVVFMKISIWTLF